MNLEQEILEQKAKIRMLEYKIQALINLLAKEGTILEEEMQAEINSILQEEKNEP